MELQIMHSKNDAYDVITPQGEVDISNYATLRQHIDETLAAGGAHLVLDLSRTEFLDSTALGAMIGSRRKAYAAGGSFAVICDRPQLMKLFQITKLDKVFSVFPSMEEWEARSR